MAERANAAVAVKAHDSRRRDAQKIKLNNNGVGFGVHRPSLSGSRGRFFGGWRSIHAVTARQTTMIKAPATKSQSGHAPVPIMFSSPFLFRLFLRVRGRLSKSHNCYLGFFAQRPEKVHFLESRCNPPC
jgi:hypothetical protein